MSQYSSAQAIDTYDKIGTSTLEKLIPLWTTEMSRTELSADIRAAYKAAITCITAILITRKHNEVEKGKYDGETVWVCRRCGRAVLEHEPAVLLEFACENRMGRSRRSK